jgi:hypothetical protein
VPLFGATPAGRLTLTHDPQYGFLTLGVASMPDGPRLRAVTMRHNAVAWDALAHQPWLDEVNDVRAIGRYVFLVQRSTVLSFDLLTGEQRWAAQLPDKLDVVASGPDHGAALLGAAPNVVVAKTVSQTAIAFDPDTGHERASRAFGSSVELTVLPGGEQLLARYRDADRGVLEVVSPTTLQAVSVFGKSWFSDEASVLEATVEGPHIVARVENWGLFGGRGVAVLDVGARREVMFERERALDPDVVPVYAGGRLYYVTTSATGALQEIWVAPGGKHVPPPLPGHRVLAMEVAGSFLFVVLEEIATSVLRLVALDPATLAPALHYGSLMPMSPTARVLRRQPNRYLLRTKNLLFVVAARDDRGAPDGELRVIEATSGQVAWTRSMGDVGRLEDWYMLGGGLVLWSAYALHVVDPMTGLSVAHYIGALAR